MKQNKEERLVQIHVERGTHGLPEDNPGGIKKADIVVGIPSYNEASSIALPADRIPGDQ
jgi:hypothetical protein